MDDHDFVLKKHGDLGICTGEGPSQTFDVQPQLDRFCLTIRTPMVGCAQNITVIANYCILSLSN